MGKSSRVRVGLVVLVLFLVVILALGCDAPPPPSLREYYDGTWLFGEHEVFYRESFQGVRGEFEGNFFLASGVIEGSFGTESMITFAWERSPGESFVTTLPISKFSFVIDEAKEIPTVEFLFNLDWTERKTVGWIEMWLVSRQEIERGNPNRYLMSEGSYQSNFQGLNTVVIRISSAALEKEPYLPK